MLGELLGVSATVTSGGGSKADESPPPTGIFLFTHQQYLTNGAMQLVTDIYNSRRYQAFTRYVLEGIVQQQLEESDGNTTLQQIRSAWLWQASGPEASETFHYQLMYTVTEGPNTQQPVVTVHQGVYGNIQTYRYPYDPREAPSHTELYDTMQNSEYNVSIPERACAFPTNTANELLTGKVYEMGTVVGLAGIRSAPYGVGDSEVIQEARATGIDVKIVDYGIQYALGSKYNIRQNIIEAQKVPPTGGIAYITYQSATSKPKASSDTEE